MAVMRVGGVLTSLFFSSSLDKITHSSSGKYECVFLFNPSSEVKQSIEVKSKLLYSTNSRFHSLVVFGNIPVSSWCHL